MVFASDTGIEVLKKAKIISVDGTFRSCPPPFLQVTKFNYLFIQLSWKTKFQKILLIIPFSSDLRHHGRTAARQLSSCGLWLAPQQEGLHIYALFQYSVRPFSGHIHRYNLDIRYHIKN
jgi:hypothetical protein